MPLVDPRLAALIPRPRANLVTYHDVLAPAASIAMVVPAALNGPEPVCSHPVERAATTDDGSTRDPWIVLLAPDSRTVLEVVIRS